MLVFEPLLLLLLLLLPWQGLIAIGKGCSPEK
jgi:hypothetical protein